MILGSLRDFLTINLKWAGMLLFDLELNIPSIYPEIAKRS